MEQQARIDSLRLNQEKISIKDINHIQSSTTFQNACKNIVNKVVDFFNVEKTMDNLCPEQRQHIGIGMAEAAIGATSPGDNYY